ncbi:hypothetical protein EIN_241150 [Entamoeba invadens IP1]|uniref:Uncharacterized protein n=1 Tax=Entamoeba invadens IP1 TaxID=370355 RepID=A0A0A1TUQ8_ENTIV|nr:hypothetical protein EIN_241150 [Entamoeba invadens IP1]ELP83808.1 hypothetical protein EIN_241150 [Entamoeba invadens IP1]|eukprot:XP_004183154.1 hypothetical protein EIN_241150 [Entamoeba invadens IP1]
MQQPLYEVALKHFNILNYLALKCFLLSGFKSKRNANKYEKDRIEQTIKNTGITLTNKAEKIQQLNADLRNISTELFVEHVQPNMEYFSEHNESLICGNLTQRVSTNISDIPNVVNENLLIPLCNHQEHQQTTPTTSTQTFGRFTSQGETTVISAFAKSIAPTESRFNAEQQDTCVIVDQNEPKQNCERSITIGQSLAHFDFEIQQNPFENSIEKSLDQSDGEQEASEYEDSEFSETNEEKDPNVHKIMSNAETIMSTIKCSLEHHSNSIGIHESTTTCMVNEKENWEDDDDSEDDTKISSKLQFKNEKSDLEQMSILMEILENTNNKGNDTIEIIYKQIDSAVIKRAGSNHQTQVVERKKFIVILLSILFAIEDCSTNEITRILDIIKIITFGTKIELAICAKTIERKMKLIHKLNQKRLENYGLLKTPFHLIADSQTCCGETHYSLYARMCSDYTTTSEIKIKIGNYYGEGDAKSWVEWILRSLNHVKLSVQQLRGISLDGTTCKANMVFI